VHWQIGNVAGWSRTARKIFVGCLAAGADGLFPLPSALPWEASPGLGPGRQGMGCSYCCSYVLHERRPWRKCYPKKTRLVWSFREALRLTLMLDVCVEPVCVSVYSRACSERTDPADHPSLAVGNDRYSQFIAARQMGVGSDRMETILVSRRIISTRYHGVEGFWSLSRV
jgi:hypothetical protein